MEVFEEKNETYQEVLERQLEALRCQADPETVLQTIDLLKQQFTENTGNRNQHLFSPDELEAYLALCAEILQYIPDSYLSREKSVPKRHRLSVFLWAIFCDLKYRGKKLTIQDGKVMGLSPYVQLSLMEYLPSGELRMDLTVDRFLLEGGLQLHVLFNETELSWDEIIRYTGKKVFGKNVARRMAFVVKVSKAQLCKKNKLEFLLQDPQGNKIRLPILALDYQCRITSEHQKSWWSFEDYMVTLEAEKSELRICQSGWARKAVRELQYLDEMMFAKNGSQRMFLIRSLYWLAHPVYSRKKIWVTFDKLYKGGDCGEYFYKYMMTRKDEGITPVYIIRKDTADYKRLKAEGFRPSVFRSMKQRLEYLYSDMIFATHSSVHSFCGFNKWQIRFLQDRLKCVNTCIQHGLSVQDLTADSNRIINNNKRYYCAAHSEMENLSKLLYNYDKDVLRLTGIPRYDGLVNQDQKIILITPTWRSYIAMPAVMGSARPYNPDFKETDYYKIYQDLLENRRLSETAKQNGYRIVYLLHPVISAQLEDFQPGPGIEIQQATQISYEQILTQASLMVTDYSGVQFDFAYMRKPVVYFHPPKLPPHYEDGGFFYDTQGFGEICTQTDELVDLLCDYMEQGCTLKPFYREREDTFFAFSDRENCRRIFEDALEYSRGRWNQEMQSREG